MRHGEQRLPGPGSRGALGPLETRSLRAGSLQADTQTRTAVPCSPGQEGLWEVGLQRGFATPQPGPWLGDAAVLRGAALKKWHPMSQNPLNERNSFSSNLEN